MWVGLGCACIAACVPADVVLSQPPDVPPGGALLFVVQVDDRTPEIWAGPAQAERFFARRIDPDATVTVTALVYEDTLDALGLSEGPVAEVSAEVCGARALPMQSNLQQVIVDQGEASDWQPLNERPAHVQELRIAGPCPCRAFEVAERLTAPEPFVAWFQQAERVLLVDAERAFWQVDAAGRLTMVETATRAPGGNVDGVLEGEGEQIWWAADGVVWRGSPLGGFEAVATVTNDTLNHLGGGLGPDGFELYGATIGGSLVQLAPGTPKVLVGPRALAINPDQRGQVLWLGPDEVVSAEHQTHELFWVRGGVETGRLQLPSDTGGAYFMQLVPQVGLLIMTRNSLLFRIDEGRAVRSFPGAPQHATPRYLIPFEGGFLYSGDSGYLQQFTTGFGFCPTQYIEGQNPVVGLFELGGQLFGFARTPGGAGMQLLVLDRRALNPDAPGQGE